VSRSACTTHCRTDRSADGGPKGLGTGELHAQAAAGPVNYPQVVRLWARGARDATQGRTLAIRRTLDNSTGGGKKLRNAIMFLFASRAEILEGTERETM